MQQVAYSTQNPAAAAYLGSWGVRLLVGEPSSDSCDADRWCETDSLTCNPGHCLVEGIARDYRTDVNASAVAGAKIRCV